MTCKLVAKLGILLLTLSVGFAFLSEEATLVRTRTGKMARLGGKTNQVSQSVQSKWQLQSNSVEDSSDDDFSPSAQTVGWKGFGSLLVGFSLLHSESNQANFLLASRYLSLPPPV